MIHLRTCILEIMIFYIVFSIEDNIVLYNKIKREFVGFVFLFDYNNILLPFYKKPF